MHLLCAQFHNCCNTVPTILERVMSCLVKKVLRHRLAFLCRETCRVCELAGHARPAQPSPAHATSPPIIHSSFYLSLNLLWSVRMLWWQECPRIKSPLCPFDYFLFCLATLYAIKKIDSQRRESDLAAQKFDEVYVSCRKHQFSRRDFRLCQRFFVHLYYTVCEGMVDILPCKAIFEQLEDGKTRNVQDRYHPYYPRISQKPRQSF